MQPRRQEIADITKFYKNSGLEFQIESLKELGKQSHRELVLISAKQCKGLFKRLGTEEKILTFFSDKENVKNKIIIVEDIRSFSEGCKEAIYDAMSKSIIYKCCILTVA